MDSGWTNPLRAGSLAWRHPGLHITALSKFGCAYNNPTRRIYFTFSHRKPQAPWLKVTPHCVLIPVDNAICRLKSGNKITKKEWKPPIDFYTKLALELGLGYSPLTSAIESHLNMRNFWSLGLWPFPDAIFYLLVGELVKNYWGKSGRFCRQLGVKRSMSTVW